MIRDPLKCACDIIKTYMSLNESQIWLFNANYKIPNTNGLFVVVQDIGSRTYGVSNKSLHQEPEFKESISIGVQKIVQIDMFSQTKEAINRQNEVIMAFSSVVSQQIQEQYGFSIGKTETNRSVPKEQVGGYMLNRVSYTTNILYLEKKENPIESLVDFDKTLIIEN